MRVDTGRAARFGLVAAAVLTFSGLLVKVPSATSAIEYAGSRGPATQTKTQPKRAGPYAVVLVVDAARFDEFDPARMPNLAKLMAAGTTYDHAWVGQLPSVTESSHATIGSGVLPKRHLILGDTWRIPGTEQMSPNLLDSTLTRTGYIGKLIRQTGSPSLAALVDQRWPGSVTAALSGHKIYAADGLGAGAADFVAFGGSNAQKHYVPSGIPGRVPATAILKSPQLDLPAYPRTPGLEDDWTTTLALKLLFKYHPRLMMINLPEVDTFGHLSGTDATVMQPLMVNVDHQIGRIVAAYQRAGLYNQTDFIITADHGMVPATHTVDAQTVKAIVDKAGGQMLYEGHGDSMSIWLKNPTAIPVVAKALSDADVPYVNAVYMRNTSGKYQLVSPVSRLQAPGLDKAYGTLLNTFDQAEAPDIELMYDENTITMTPLFQQIGRKGDHGGASWGAQHIPLVVAGPGIRAGYTSTYPARLVDIAPTVETLMQITPAHQDGVPLADAMLKPPAWATAQQSKRGQRLGPEVDALIQSAAAQHG